MTAKQSDNKRIVQNTLSLYFRMFITISIGLFTSRVVLNTLGVSDFGVFSLVGGLVLSIAFLNTGMLQASQRFLSYELGRGDDDGLKKVFSTSLCIHIAIALLVILLSETIGVYLINCKLNIPTDRVFAANWVFQCSIFTFVVSVLSVPYNSCIVAHEHMSFYAYISILEAVLKLLIVYLLVLASWDKLVFYAVLLLCVQIIIRFIYTLYCNWHFSECHAKLTFEKPVFIKMFTFAGWSIVGNLGYSFRDQGTSIILNLFFGTVVNAARGVASHVSVMINSFATNVTMALNPPITKNYAAGNYERSAQLVYAGSRAAFYLLSLLTIPFLINSEYILHLWLGVVPKNTSLFLYFILASSLLYSMSQPVTVAIQATGKIKVFQILVCSLMLVELIATYIVLKLTGRLLYSLIPALIANTFAVFLRFFLLKRMVPIYSWWTYVFNVFLRSTLVFVICFFCSYTIHRYVHVPNFFLFLGESVLYVGIVLFFVAILGLDKAERIIVYKKASSVISNKLKHGKA